jgi:hypothetical protein
MKLVKHAKAVICLWISRKAEKPDEMQKSCVFSKCVRSGKSQITANCTDKKTSVIHVRVYKAKHQIFIAPSQTDNGFLTTDSQCYQPNAAPTGYNTNMGGIRRRAMYAFKYSELVYVKEIYKRI